MKNLKQMKKMVKKLMKIYQNKKKNPNNPEQAMEGKKTINKTVSNPLNGDRICPHSFLNQTVVDPSGKHGLCSV